MELIRRALRGLDPDVPKTRLAVSTPDQDAVRFAMQHNGFRPGLNGEWIYDQSLVKPLVEQFKGTRVSFFGPGLRNLQNIHFSGDNLGHHFLEPAFNQKGVTDTLNKLRAIDDTTAARISFILGELIRHLTIHPTLSLANTTDSVKFVSQLTYLGGPKSTEAIAAACSMYIISGGRVLANDPLNHLKESVYYMAEAIDKDPVTLSDTNDLGLSQLARLRYYFAKGKGGTLPDIDREWQVFKGFPTVGAEFHFSPDAPFKFPNFWQRLAVLNMSQYNPGSYIQLSRNDRGVIEVRMNPSSYPVAVATWKHLQLLLPELNQAFFTTTLSRNISDFAWENVDDYPLLAQLRAVGMVCYASNYQDVPPKGKQAEISFGSVYLGQTVRLSGDDFLFTGLWSGKQGDKGQLGVYSGFGANFPDLAFNLSVVLAAPNVLGNRTRRVLSRVNTLEDALNLKPSDRMSIFHSIKNLVESNSRLREISSSGKRIMQLLNP